MEDLKLEAERAEREGNYQRVAEIRYGELKQLQDQMDTLRKRVHDEQGGEALVREEVTADDIAEVVSRWTGIPVSRMMQSEREKLLHLRTNCINVSSDKTRLSMPFAMLSDAVGQDFRTPNDRLHPSSSWERQALERQNWRKLWPSTSSMTRI